MIKYLYCLIKKDWAKDGKMLSRNCPQAYRVHSVDGISPTLNANGGGASGSSVLIEVEDDEDRKITEVCESE